jgi:hypothetical protein
MERSPKFRNALLLAIIWATLILGACGNPAPDLSPVTSHTELPTAAATNATETVLPATVLSADQIATLSSLEKVDNHPLYTMRYYGDYEPSASAISLPDRNLDWACSLFTAMADSENMLYGRNFDWRHSPAVLLFSAPPGGYASVSMVDIEYLGFEGEGSRNLLDLPLNERQALLTAPSLPFDGMNEYGLVVGMAAVPPGGMRPEPDKATIGSLGIIRQILDRARTVEQAIAIFQEYNIDFGGGPPIHYLIADRARNAALVEFHRGKMNVTYNEDPWHQATNFLRAAIEGSPQGQCWRYDRLSARLSSSNGQLTPESAMELLAEVSQDNTQWSVVYDYTGGGIRVVMDRAYEDVHAFQLKMAVP